MHRLLDAALRLFLLPFVFQWALQGIASADDGQTATLRMATGNEKGVYHSLGRGIADIAGQSGITIHTQNSQGSRENLNLLSLGEADLCLAQSDTVYNAYNGLAPFAERIRNIKVIASLYTEAVHILVRGSLYIKSIDEFRGKRISIGPVGSGTESNGLLILEAAGITAAEVQLQHLDVNESIDAIKNNTVDIAFFTSGHPSDVVSRILRDSHARFFELRSEYLKRFLEKYQYFVVTPIAAGTYPHQDEQITTVGVPALLVASTNVNQDRIYELTRSIFTHADRLERYHRLGREIDLRTVLQGVPIPLADGADRHYREMGVHRNEFYGKLLLKYGLPAAMLLLVVLFVVKFQNIKLFFKKRDLARVLAVLCAIWVIGSCVLYYTEHRINEGYSSFIQSFWSSLINWINFGQREPYTATGRFTSIVMTILGLGGIAWLTGEITSIFVHKKMTGGRKMEKMQNHYVIVNWNDKGPGLVRQLLSSDLKQKPVVLANCLMASPLPQESQKEQVAFVRAETIDEGLLRKAGVHRAFSIIILTDYGKGGETADAQTILSILTIAKICRQENKRVSIVAELINPQKVSLAEYAGVLGENCVDVEIVSSQYIAQNLLAQVAVTPGLTKVYEDLLTFGEKTSEIYGVPLPSKYVGKTFDELLKSAFNLRERNICIVPIAIYREGKMHLNPSKIQIDPLRQGDMLYSICDSQAELQNLN